ncbi:MAG: helix-turn-helix transcriptional regulator [Clostridiales bacterium]|nr:helix-turn-helix transcriptional regulator [Clostridiales bacterium]
MSIQCPNLYLDKLASPKGREFVHKKNFFGRKAPEDWLEGIPVGRNRSIGEYYIFTWEGGFDPAREIVVTMDSYHPGKNLVYHSHDFFEIVYVYSGHCRTHISGNPTCLCAGDICLYNLQAIHKMECLAPGDAVFNIVLRKDLFHRFLLELLSENDAVSAFFTNSLYNGKSADTCILIKAGGEYRCEELAQKIVETYYQDPPMCQSTMKAMLILLLVELTRQYQNDSIQSGCSSAGGLNLADVIAYISNHYRHVTLEETSRHFGYSTRSMARFLQKNTGYTFREIIQDVRFSHARSMLQENRMSIGDIAVTIGYGERSNFEKAFKKYCHLSPAAYRRQFFVG